MLRAGSRWPVLSSLHPTLPMLRLHRIFSVRSWSARCRPCPRARSPAGLTDADVLRLKAVGGVAIAPTGDRILYTVTGWEHPAAKSDTALGDRHDRRSHVWIVPFAGGASRQLTFGERGESQPSWSPDGKTIAFIAARGSGTGDDAPKPQVWLLPADGGEARQLTTMRDGVVGLLLVTRRQSHRRHHARHAHARAGSAHPAPRRCEGVRGRLPPQPPLGGDDC